jgi:hypothetical protein
VSVGLTSFIKKKSETDDRKLIKKIVNGQGASGTGFFRKVNGQDANRTDFFHKNASVKLTYCIRIIELTRYHTYY